MNAPAAPSALSPALLQGLQALIGSRVSTSESDRAQHGRDQSHHPVQLPDAVCRALSTEEVSAIVRLCAEHGTPVVAYGAGSSLEGALIPARGGVSLDLTGMNAILSVRPEDLDATVQAGVTRKQLNAHLRDTGLFFPVDPGADATIGGMAATRASGTNAVRYGTMRENVVSLTVVLADGRVIRTRSRARKSSAGYDLTGLFVGQEGTLGIITEVTVRLYGIPEVVAAAVCPFPSVEAAVDTVIQTIQMGIPVSRVELLDDNTIQAVNAYSKLGLEVAPTLFFEFAGSEGAVAEQAALVEEIARGEGATAWSWSTDAGERSRLWQARHDVHWAIRSLYPGAPGLGTDVCVPISALAEIIRETRRDIAARGLVTTLVGHVGDGNFHLGLRARPDDPDGWQKVLAANDLLVTRAIALGGTCTGEHGVGIGKRKFMRLEHGEAVDVMQLLKAALDPKGILNPGKVLPEA